MRRSLLVLPLLLLLLLAGPASAHTSLVGELPAAGSTVETVTQVVLDFSDEVQVGLATVAVTGPDGVDRSQGAPVLQDGTRVVQGLTAPLTAGRWTVAYRVVAGDGHPVVGSHVFDVTAPAAAPQPSAAAPAPETAPQVATTPLAERAPDGGLPLVPVALAGLALAGVTGLLLARGRGPSRA